MPPPHGDGLQLVDNATDSMATVAYLTQLGGLGPGYAVVRPTPGGSDRYTTLGKDLLAALGKNPETLRRELRAQPTTVRPDPWRLAAAWTVALDVRDLVVDRAHALHPADINGLARLATSLRVRLWLIWSSRRATASTRHQLRRAGYLLTDRTITGMIKALPPPPARTPSPPRTAEPAWPALPMTDFPTFHTTCRRLLTTAQFAQVDLVYQAATVRAGAWLATHRTTTGGLPHLEELAGSLLRWLRDDVLTALTPAAVALIQLRAVQEVLFGHAILLRWDPSGLGPGPAARLPGDLTPVLAARLGALSRTDHVAATALALHLNHRVFGFPCWRCGDVAIDGSRLDEPAQHHHQLPLWMGYREYRTARAHCGPGTGELSCTGPVIIPEHARPLIAVHLTHRLLQGARDDDPFFLHPLGRDDHDSTRMLREAVLRTCRWLHISPSWLHRHPCQYGHELGRPRVQGWLVERGLSLHQLSPGQTP